MATTGNPLTDHLDLWTSALLNKSTAGRGRNGKQEAYGIKKLRGLILELAVRGKLVPQDPNDEPASMLLDEITQEKARLLKAGTIKAPKALPTIGSTHVPFDLPEGWAWVRLGTISSKITDGDHKTPPRIASGYRLLSAKNVRDGYLDLDNCDFISEQAYTKSRERCLPAAGDLLIVSVGGTIGRTSLVPADAEFALVRSVALIKPLLINSSYLKHAMDSDLLQSSIHARKRGGAQPCLYLSEIENFLFSLPPLSEQHRIVAKVDELMALCDRLEQQQADSQEAHQTLVETLLGALTQIPVRPELRATSLSRGRAVEGRPSTGPGRSEFEETWTRIADHFDILFTTEHSIEQLKQTILQLAVMGKLVPQDRNDEPASKALRQCFQQKSSLIDQGKMRAERPLPQIGEDEKLWALPPGWEWERFGRIFGGGSGSTPLRSNDNYFINGTENWFKTTDLNLAVVIDGEEKITKEAVDDYNLIYYPPGTVCIAMYGGAGTIGKSAILGTEATINQSVFALPPVEQILPEYLHIFVKTVRDKWMRYAAGLRKDPNINGLIIKKMVMPVPPLAEQHRIVAKVDELMALCDTLKARLKAARSIQFHLADAIVEQAVA